MDRVAIVVVTHNSASEIGACLEAAVATGQPVWVIDNASEDNTLSEARKHNVHVLANQTNLGFAAAVNQGVRAAGAELILLLNPDAVLRTDPAPLVHACSRPEAAAAAGKLVNSNGEIQRGFTVRRLPSATALTFEVLGVNRLWPGNPVNWHYRCLDMNLDLPAEVEQPAGAFCMFRRDVWERLGGWDEGFYPLWFEDVDFCRRARDAGFLIYYEAAAEAVHSGGHSVGKIPLECRELYWYGSLLRYVQKHFCPAERRMVCMAVMLGSIPRMLTGIFTWRSLKPIAVYIRVMSMAARKLGAGSLEQEGLASSS